MFCAAIFDADGTLFDSMPYWENLGADFLRSLGKIPAPDLNATLKTLSMAQGAQHFQSAYSVTLSEKQINAALYAMAEAHYRSEIALKPGAADFLEALAQKGVKMCIATATDEYLVRMALARCGVEKYFSKIFTCDEVGQGKDAPEIYRAALKHLGATREDTLVFEDAFHAAQTAKNDGFITIGVYDAQEPRQKELRALCDIFLDNFCQLRPFWAFCQKCEVALAKTPVSGYNE